MGVSLTKDDRTAKYTATASHLHSDNKQFAEIQAFVQTMKLPVRESKVEVAPKAARRTKDEQEARLALARLKQLESSLSLEHEIFKVATFDDLVRSKNLRSLILDYDGKLLRMDPKPRGSFERKYSDARDKLIAEEQEIRQTSIYNLLMERPAIAKHNAKVSD